MADQSAENGCPRNVSPRMWEKFQKLKGRRRDVTKNCTNKRRKPLQSDDSVKEKEDTKRTEELKHLGGNTVVLDDARAIKQRRETQVSKSVQPSSRTDSESAINEWKGIQEYLGCNDHLKGVDRGKCGPKSGLEEKLDVAIQECDYSTAEEISDRLAAREFGTKITEAIDAKRYAEKKMVEDKKAKEKRKKKLHWGFSEKQRWETKSNM